MFVACAESPPETFERGLFRQLAVQAGNLTQMLFENDLPEKALNSTQMVVLCLLTSLYCNCKKLIAILLSLQRFQH